jgi:hypothetical protein
MDEVSTYRGWCEVVMPEASSGESQCSRTFLPHLHRHITSLLSPHILSAIVAPYHTAYTTHHLAHTNLQHLQTPTNTSSHNAGPHALDNGEIHQQPSHRADGAQCRERVHAERSQRESHTEDAGGAGRGEAI